jgi:hypothetical protein
LEGLGADAGKPSFCLSLAPDFGDPVTWPQGFAEPRHLEFIVPVADDDRLSLGECENECLSRFLHTVAERDLIASEAAPFLGGGDDEIANLARVRRGWRCGREAGVD